jgi:hypothetical protein
MAEVYPGIEQFLANLPAVQGGLEEVAQAGASRATAILAGHKHTGRMHIEVTRGDVDRHVCLVDPDDGAVAAELGHITPGGKAVPGINVLKTAFGL